jgi:hypothetical protein
MVQTPNLERNIFHDSMNQVKLRNINVNKFKYGLVWKIEFLLLRIWKVCVFVSMNQIMIILEIMNRVMHHKVAKVIFSLLWLESFSLWIESWSSNINFSLSWLESWSSKFGILLVLTKWLNSCFLYGFVTRVMCKKNKTIELFVHLNVFTYIFTFDWTHTWSCL